MTEIDLHIHTVASEDGELPPREIFVEAKRVGLRAIAFADHDSVASVDEGMALSRAFGIDFAPAVELSTRTGGYDLHVLGYFIDWTSTRLAEVLAQQARWRNETAERRVAKLTELGFAISLADVLDAAGGRGPTTRAILEALKKRPDNLENTGFSRYLTGDRADSPVYNFYRDWFVPGRPAFVEQHALAPRDALKLVHDLDGVAVLAHPGRTPAELVDALVPEGLDGIEVYCTTHTDDDVAFYEQVVREHGLLATAGSDYHGATVKPDITIGSGRTRAEYAMFEQLRARTER